MSMAEGQFFDVTFVVGYEELTVYGVRSCLASISPVFKAMFYGEMKEAQYNSVIRVPDCHPSAFQCIIRYSHGINPKIDVENCFHVHKIAEKYQVSSLSPFLEIFISKIMNEENYCILFHSALEISSTLLQKTCLKALKNLNSMAILSSESFVTSLSSADLQILLESEDFQVPEECLWERCLEWADYRAQQLAQDIKSDGNKLSTATQALCSIKSCIRFAAMSAEFLVTKVYPLSVLDPVEYSAVISDVVAPGGERRSCYSSLSRIPKVKVNKKKKGWIMGLWEEWDESTV